MNTYGARFVCLLRRNKQTEYVLCTKKRLLDKLRDIIELLLDQNRVYRIESKCTQFTLIGFDTFSKHFWTHSDRFGLVFLYIFETIHTYFGPFWPSSNIFFYFIKLPKN